MLVDASGNPLRSSALPFSIGQTYGIQQLTDLIERIDSFAPSLQRVPSVIGTIETRRADRWVNYNTGIGTLADKTRQGFFDAVWRIPDQELTNLANGSDLAAKIIEKRPKEMFRRGFDLKANPLPGRGNAGGKKARGKAPIDQSAVKDFRDWCTEELALEDRFKQAMIYGRQFGGTLALLGLVDGRDPGDPLDEENIESFSFINVIDRRFCWVNSYYANPDEPKFGMPETYMVSNGVAAQDYRPQAASKIKRRGWSTMVVHETRVLRFDGVPTDTLTQQQLAGWSWSILQRVYEVLRQFDHGFDSATYLLSDASQGIFKLKGLLQAISSGNKQWLEQRLQMMEQTRSVLRGVAVDADEKSGESFTRVVTPLTGIPEMLDRLMQRVAAGADMPVQELFGAGAGGLNAAGEAQAATRKWYDTIRGEAQDQVAPKLARLFRLAALSSSSPIGKKDARWGVTFHALWEPTDDELAGTRLKNAQRDQIYVESEIVSPEVVALTLTDIYPSLDEDEIEASIEAKKTFDPHKNDPPPPGGEGSPIPAGGPAKPGPLPQKTPAPQTSPLVQARGNPGEGQSPTLPLPGPPGEQSGALTTAQSRSNDVPPPKKKKGDRTKRADEKPPNTLAEAVHAQLAPDYPEDAISWVHAGHWGGPKRVPLDKLDFSNMANWAAAQEPEKVGGHVKRIGQGIEKPIILLRGPYTKKLSILDGHHRALAYRSLRKQPYAYIVRVHAQHGPWESMHARQKSTGLEYSAQSNRGKRDGLESPEPDAVVAIMRNGEGKILAVRSTGDGWRSKAWTLPGGRIDEGESQEAALRREVAEETGLEITASEPVQAIESPTDGRRVFVWLVTGYNGTPAPDGDEIAEIDWLTPEQLRDTSDRFRPSVEALWTKLKEPQTATKVDAVPLSELPKDFGTAVPAAGSHCANCRFLASSKPPTCGNETFAGWVKLRLGKGAGKPPAPIPAPDGDPARYCCSAWQAAPGVLK